MHLHRARQKVPRAAAARVVEGLERRRTPQTLVDGGPPRQTELRIRRVDRAAPECVAPSIELVRMLLLEQRLGDAVANLLSPERTNGRPPMVPHQSGRAEAEPMPAVQ